MYYNISYYNVLYNNYFSKNQFFWKHLVKKNYKLCRSQVLHAFAYIFREPITYEKYIMQKGLLIYDYYNKLIINI